MHLIPLVSRRVYVPCTDDTARRLLLVPSACRACIYSRTARLDRTFRVSSGKCNAVTWSRVVALIVIRGYCDGIVWLMPDLLVIQVRRAPNLDLSGLPGPGSQRDLPSIPAVLRPALRCVTCRTLTDVLARLRSISFSDSLVEILTQRIDTITDVRAKVRG